MQTALTRMPCGASSFESAFVIASPAARVTVVGIEFGSLVAFSTITETVFAWPGVGKLLIDSVYQLDRPVVVAYVLLATLLFVTVNFLVDVLYAALDPRVKLAGEQA